MPKKMFDYKNFQDMKNVWYTDSLKGWFIVKENGLYILRKGCILDSTIEFTTKRYNTYKRLGDAKTGLERKLKEKTQRIVEQQILFDRLKAENTKVIQENKNLDYTELNKQAEKLKIKWGLR